jgi:hypothetical protein
VHLHDYLEQQRLRKALRERIAREQDEEVEFRLSGKTSYEEVPL